MAAFVTPTPGPENLASTRHSFAFKKAAAEIVFRYVVGKPVRAVKANDLASPSPIGGNGEQARQPAPSPIGGNLRHDVPMRVCCSLQDAGYATECSAIRYPPVAGGAGNGAV